MKARKLSPTLAPTPPKVQAAPPARQATTARPALDGATVVQAMVARLAVPSAGKPADTGYGDLVAVAARQRAGLSTTAAGAAGKTVAPALRLSAGSAPVVQREETKPGSEEERFWHEISELMNQGDKPPPGGDKPPPGGPAWAARIELLAWHESPGPSVTAERVDQLVDQIATLASDENETLKVLGPEALDKTAAFPKIWSKRVFDALHMDVDDGALKADVDAQVKALAEIAETTPDRLFATGVPATFQEAIGLTRFPLRVAHAHLARPNVTRDFAAQALSLARATGVRRFYAAWNGIATGASRSVAEGTLVVSAQDLATFVKNRGRILATLPDRLRRALSDEDLQAVQDDVLSLANAAMVAAFVSELSQLKAIITTWDEQKAFFARKLAVTDSKVAAEGRFARVWRALTWAHENGYFAGAGEGVWQAIVAHGPEMLKETAAIIAAQLIPGVDVAVDVYLMVKGGVDLIKGLAGLTAAVVDASGATSTVGLQSSAAHLAQSLLGDGMTVLISLFGAAMGKRQLDKKIGDIRGKSPGTSLAKATEEAVEQSEFRAAKEASRFLDQNKDSALARFALGRTYGNAKAAQELVDFLKRAGLSDVDLAAATLRDLEGPVIARLKLLPAPVVRKLVQVGSSAAKRFAALDEATLVKLGGADLATLRLLARAEGEAFEILARELPAAALPRLRAMITQSASFSGMTEEALMQTMAVSMKNGVIIRFRRTNPAAAALRKLGHSPKPEFLKMKTMNKLDAYLREGATQEGVVAYFKPRRPQNLADIKLRDPALAARIEQRYQQRLEELIDYQATMQKLQAKGVVKVEDGVVIDMRPGPGQGKAFTGDYDIFSLATEEGESLSSGQASRVLDDLKKPPVGAQHPAHLDWKVRKPGEKAMKENIIRGHTEGGDPLVEFKPDGSVDRAFAEPLE